MAKLYSGGPRKFSTVIKRAKFSKPGVSPDAMLRIANALNQAVARRLDGGLDVYDNPAPPLSAKYAKFKVQGRYKQPGIRNMKLTGRTRRSMVVLEVRTNRAVLGFSTPQANQIVNFNKKYSAQYGASPKDMRVVVDALNQELNGSGVIRVEQTA